MSTYLVISSDSIKNNLFDNSQLGIVQNLITLEGSSIIVTQNNQEIENNQTKIATNSDIISKSIPNAVPKNNEKVDNLTVYNCITCNQSFNKLASYKKHIKMHVDAKKYKCDNCNVAFNVETNLKIHSVVHAEGTPSCPICDITFQRLASLKSHLMLHQVEETYTCEECGAEFDKIEEINKHALTHSNKENKNLTCNACKVEFDDPIIFKEHISYHIKIKKMTLPEKKYKKKSKNGNYPHVCFVCQKSFAKLSLLERHLRIHSGEKPFGCPICEKSFTQKGTLKFHLSKHKGIKPFHCTLCNAKFCQKGNLRVHVEKTHAVPLPGVQTFKCSLCTCVFKKLASLNVHMTKSHATIKDIGDINNVMKQLKELERQITTVTPDMKSADKEIIEQNKKILQEIKDGSYLPNVNYVKLIEYEGSTRKYLVKLRNVNGTKFYLCNYCTKEFKKPSDLIRHTRVHTRERPFKCKQCNAAFSLKSTLFYHLETHKRKRSYVCEICNKEFSSIRTFNIHSSNQHVTIKNPQYKCSTCHKHFNSLYKAKMHKQTHTNEQSTPNVIMKQPLLKTTHGFLSMPPPKTKNPHVDSSNSRPFQCQVCNLRFIKSTHLKRHMLLHDEDKKFKCDQCSKLSGRGLIKFTQVCGACQGYQKWTGLGSYVTSYALKKHLLIHTGLKDNVCKICGKKFVSACLLKRHQISHNTQRPYLCPYCDKTFKSVIMCRKHIKIHKKDINVQLQALNETGELGNLNESDKTKIISLTDNINEEAFKVVENTISENTSLLNIDNNKSKSINVANSEIFVQDSIENLEATQNLSGNAIQIVENADNAITDPNQVQIFINYEDLSILNSNLYPSIKQNNSESFILGSLSDFPDSILVDDIDKSSEIYNTNQIFNTLPSIDELTKKASPKDPIANLLCDGIQYFPNDINSTNDSQNIPLMVLSSLTPSSIASMMVFDSNEITNNSGNVYENTSVICTKCNKLISLVSDVESHQCVQDNANIESSIVMNSSDKKVESSMNLSCNKCEKIFSDKIMFDKHQLNHKNSNGFECSFCCKGFKKSSDLNRHIRIHTGEKPFQCTICEKRFTLKSTLDSHLRTHNPVSVKEYNCSVCNSFFSSKASLKVHLQLHTGNKPHQCNFCPSKFRTAAHKKLHETNQHLNPNKKKAKPTKTTDLLASVAVEASSNLLDITNNQNKEVHLNDIPIILNETTTNGNLSDTIQIDPIILEQLQSANLLVSDNLLEATSIIQLEDGTILNLKPKSSDVIINDKLRTLECSICHKKYASKDVLRKHEKRHGINKKFPCTKCDKGFDLMSDLEKHDKVHSGERPFACFLCKNSFAREKNLKIHLRRIHQVTSYSNT